MPLRLSLPRQTIVPLIVACGLFMENLDSTVVATALPAIARSLHEDPLRLNLAITSYLLSLAVFIPLSGWLADRIGARTVFGSAIVVFTLGSIGCGFSETLGQLVATRMLQGLGGAMMVPVGRLVLMRTIPKAELVNAMTYLTVPALIGPIMGPPVGGFIVTYSSWRWIFFINIPIGILGVLLTRRFIPDLTEEVRRPLDGRGFALTGLGLVGLMFGFETIGRDLLPNQAVGGLLAIGAICTALYALHARHTPNPILDLSLFKYVTFRANTMGGTLFRTGIGALPFLLPMMFQLAFGLTAFSSGLLTFTSTAGAMFMKMTAARIIRRFGFRRVLIGNAVISTAFILSYALFKPSTPHALIIATLLAGGFFRSLQFTSLQTIAYAEVAPAQMSQATTMVSVAQQLALTFGVGLGAMLLHLTVWWSGGAELTPAHFSFAFLGVGLVSLASLPLFIALPVDAGSEISGRRAAAPSPRAPSGP
ncbi:MAG TPA: DHA2 family efflux MFS transporter permease subunit [Alphaproteobacteria bacterium]|nr:DHA2 family efflux MFS transporter permease subunit [Alphaproteobacteria bacterium]